MDLLCTPILILHSFFKLCKNQVWMSSSSDLTLSTWKIQCSDIREAIKEDHNYIFYALSGIFWQLWVIRWPVSEFFSWHFFHLSWLQLNCHCWGKNKQGWNILGTEGVCQSPVQLPRSCYPIVSFLVPLETTEELSLSFCSYV